MNHYVEIRLAPDPEFPPTFLMNALFGKLHRALVEGQHSDIGVSFPKYREGARTQTLGNILRLHGAQAALERLMNSGWLKNMRDHIETDGCQPTPSSVKGYRTVKRQQFKTNAERLRRRRAKRHGETLEQARALIPDSIECEITLPYLQISSQSTRQRFCLFVEHGPLQKEPDHGSFNAYGLSHTATVPWF